MKICKCIDCKKTITKHAKRCRSCAMKELFKSKTKHPNYKDGRTLKQYFCKKCGTGICMQTEIYGFGMCKSCIKIGKNHPFFGRKHTKKSRDKMSKVKTGIKRNPFTKATRDKMSKSIKISMNRPEIKQKMSGKNSVHYIHGQSNLPYTKEFTPVLRNKIRQRDNDTCQNPKCNCTQKEHLNKYNSSLEIHHIDHCTFNCEETNLIALCKKHNLNANKNIDYWYAYYTYIMENKNEIKR